MLNNSIDHLDHLIQKLTMRYGAQDPDVLRLRMEFNERIAAAAEAKMKFATRRDCGARTSSRRSVVDMARSRSSTACH